MNVTVNDAAFTFFERWHFHHWPMLQPMQDESSVTLAPPQHNPPQHKLPRHNAIQHMRAPYATRGPENMSIAHVRLRRRTAKSTQGREGGRGGRRRRGGRGGGRRRRRRRRVGTELTCALSLVGEMVLVKLKLFAENQGCSYCAFCISESGTSAPLRLFVSPWSLNIYIIRITFKFTFSERDRIGIRYR